MNDENMPTGEAQKKNKKHKRKQNYKNLILKMNDSCTQSLIDKVQFKLTPQTKLISRRW